MKILLTVLLLSILSLADSNNGLLSPNKDLSDREIHSMKLAKKWLNSKDKSFRGKDGSVSFMFGATMPRIVASPNRPTDIELEAGEVIRDMHAGDQVRWILAPAISGDGANMISHIIVKPMDAGLETTLVVMTDRRTYHMNLLSHQTDYMPIVSFKYPQQLKKKWDRYKDYMSKQKSNSTFSTPGGSTRIENLNFNYTVKGNASWKPLRVYNNGKKTYISMPSTMKHNEAPVLMVLDASSNKQLVNYRLKKDTYVVDKLFDTAVLIVGVGVDQEKITIYRNSTRQPRGNLLDLLDEEDEDM